VAVGRKQRYTAIGNYDDESAIDITDRVLWTSSDESIATVLGGAREGRVEGVAPGSVTISAALDGVTGNATLLVTPAVAVSLDVAPDTAIIRVDGEKQFTAIAVLSDGSRREVTDEVTWTSQMPGVASESNDADSPGVAHGLSVGTTVVTATLDGTLQDSATLRVIAPVVSVLVAPSSESVSVGSNVYYRATAVLLDATQLDVTSLVEWTSSDPDVAAISNAGTHGRATALAEGSTTIRATLLGTTGSFPATLSGASDLAVAGACDGTPDSVFIASDLTIRVGDKAQMQLSGAFPGGCTQDLTEDSATVWDSTDNDVFTIDHKTGIVTGIGPGAAQAEVRHKGETDSATVMVLP
jgi:uncharacterized protein YjdB